MNGVARAGLSMRCPAVARPRADNGTAAHLGRGGGIHLLRVRVALLMGYATSRPRCHCSRTAPKLAALAIVLFATLPHYLGDDIIVDLHQSTERIAVELGADR